MFIDAFGIQEKILVGIKDINMKVEVNFQEKEQVRRPRILSEKTYNGNHQVRAQNTENVINRQWWNCSSLNWFWFKIF